MCVVVNYFEVQHLCGRYIWSACVKESVTYLFLHRRIIVIFLQRYNLNDSVSEQDIGTEYLPGTILGEFRYWKDASAWLPSSKRIRILAVGYCGLWMQLPENESVQCWMVPIMSTKELKEGKEWALEGQGKLQEDWAGPGTMTWVASEGLEEDISKTHGGRGLWIGPPGWCGICILGRLRIEDRLGQIVECL